MNALRRLLSEKNIDLSKPIHSEVLRTLKVNMGDLIQAMNMVHTSLLREVYVEVPEDRWSDIGGLDDVKQQLREAVR